MVGSGVLVSDGIGVQLGMGVNVLVGTGTVLVLVGVMVGTNVSVAVGVMEGVQVLVGVKLGSGVAVGEDVLVGGDVADGGGGGVGVQVVVGVGDGVQVITPRGMASRRSWHPLAKSMITPKSLLITPVRGPPPPQSPLKSIDQLYELPALNGRDPPVQLVGELSSKAPPTPSKWKSFPFQRNQSMLRAL